MGLGALGLAVPGRGGGDERTEEGGGGPHHFVDRPIERLPVRSGRDRESGDFPHELQSRRPDLLVGRRRLEVV